MEDTYKCMICKTQRPIEEMTLVVGDNEVAVCDKCVTNTAKEVGITEQILKRVLDILFIEP